MEENGDHEDRQTAGEGKSASVGLLVPHGPGRTTARERNRQAGVQGGSSLGSIGISLCLANAATLGATNVKAEERVEALEQRARGKADCQVVVQAVLEGAPAHAAGIAKVFSSPRPLALAGIKSGACLTVSMR
jgi:hypothetical protein